MQMSYVRKLLPTSGIKKKYTENQLPSEVKNGIVFFSHGERDMRYFVLFSGPSC